MDFADDFTYFSMNEILQEVKRLYGKNKYVTFIGMSTAANEQLGIKFVVTKPRHLTIAQMGLPLRFRNLPVVFKEASNNPVY